MEEFNNDQFLYFKTKDRKKSPLSLDLTKIKQNQKASTKT